MNLVIDVGNSRIKTGCFAHDTLMQQNVFVDTQQLQSALGDTLFDNILVSSVTHSPDVAANLQSVGMKWVLHHGLPLPIHLLYATPQTLGVDRIASACGARSIFPNSNCLVIDVGTCINYEFVDAQGNYHGGAISPGKEMRFKAMHSFTSKLPFVTWNDAADLIGNSTESCLQSGVLHGMIGEMDSVMEQYARRFSGLEVILCGGDAALFENKLKRRIFAAPDLVLMGLNRILRYNAS